MPVDFLDEARIYVEGGRGGDGAVHFRREKYVPLGGPDGGDGGQGGSVILAADTNLNTLLEFRYRRRFEAHAGARGTGNRKHGKAAADIVVSVPVGTSIYNDETGELVVDLAHDGARHMVARGGKGGLGNQHFATSTRQAPEFAEKGEPGEGRWLRLELKLVADVGLVGLPNAGKSTLLASITAARPKIAGYPFTTLTPNLGVVGLDDYSFVVADIPGLIEGAHQGHGLGDQFLRHIERTRVLVRVLDGSSEDPLADFEQVSRELFLYAPDLLDKPQLVAVNKMDLPDAEGGLAKVSSSLSAQGYQAFPISGVTHQGIDSLLTAMRVTLEGLPPREELNENQDEEFVFRARPDPDHFTVERKRGTFRVQGETVHQVVSMTDTSSKQALERLQRQLKRLGVFQALEREGIRPGNKVLIGEYELIWEGELEPGLATPSGQKGPGNRHQTEKGTRAYRGRHRG